MFGSIRSSQKRLLVLQERLARTDLAIRIADVIRARRLTQAGAARILKIDQPKISRLLRGELFRVFNRTPHAIPNFAWRNVEIAIETAPRARRQGHLRGGRRLDARKAWVEAIQRRTSRLPLSAAKRR